MGEEGAGGIPSKGGCKALAWGSQDSVSALTCAPEGRAEEAMRRVGGGLARGLALCAHRRVCSLTGL